MRQAPVDAGLWRVPEGVDVGHIDAVLRLPIHRVPDPSVVERPAFEGRRPTGERVGLAVVEEFIRLIRQERLVDRARNEFHVRTRLGNRDEERRETRVAVRCVHRRAGVDDVDLLDVEIDVIRRLRLWPRTEEVVSEDEDDAAGGNCGGDQANEGCV